MKKFALAILLSAAYFPFVSHASVLLWFTPSTSVVSTGQLLSVDVSISGLGNPPSVGAYDLDVAFDAGLLSPLGVDFDVFLGDPSLLEALTVFDLSIAGLVDFASVSLLTATELDLLQASSFRLATLSFMAIADGIAEFRFVGDVRVDDAFGIKLVIPEPGAPILLAAALWAFLSAPRTYRKRKRPSLRSP